MGTVTIHSLDHDSDVCKAIVPAAYRNHAGLYADFHSIRHTFITNLCKADVSPKTAQMPARYSDIWHSH